MNDNSLLNRLAVVALNGIHREYPNHMQHLLQGPGDWAEPHKLHPVFYGCFDWHSAVHNHWLLVRLLRLHPELPSSAAARAALNQSFTPDKVAGECDYISAPDRSGFERPYGRAWLLQLTAELRYCEYDESTAWLNALRPLESLILEQLSAWVPRLLSPVRSGVHSQTAFAFGLMLDWCETSGDFEFAELITDRATAFFANDRNAPINYEPSGEDFLSPSLMEADLMRRVLPTEQFSVWLGQLIPEIPTDGDGTWLQTGMVSDPTDGRLVHLAGLNLSRAWALGAIADALPASDQRSAALKSAAQMHATKGIESALGDHYAGSHWLASFAVYLLTRSSSTSS